MNILKAIFSKVNRRLDPKPGYSDERIHIFCATDLAPAKQALDMDEILHVHEVRFDDAIAMIQRGEIQDGKTISGLFMASLWLNPGVSVFPADSNHRK
ncbi:MAG: NUDIX hydrolase [Pseudomonadota bacterium]